MSKRKLIEDLAGESNVNSYKRLVHQNYLQYLQNVGAYKDAGPPLVSVYEYNKEGVCGAPSISNNKLSESSFEQDCDDSDDDSDDDAHDNIFYLTDDYDSSEDKHTNKPSLSDDLAVLFVKKQMHVSHVNGVLEVLNKHKDEAIRVPKTRATLVKTPKEKITTRALPNGSEHYYGLKKALKNRGHLLKDLTEIEIDIGIDGAKLHKSSKSELWPTMGCITNLQNIRPFLISKIVHNY